LGGLHKVTMFNSLFRVLPSRVSDYLTASYFTGGLESDDHAWANEKLLRTTSKITDTCGLKRLLPVKCM